MNPKEYIEIADKKTNESDPLIWGFGWGWGWGEVSIVFEEQNNRNWGQITVFANFRNNYSLTRVFLLLHKKY